MMEDSLIKKTICDSHEKYLRAKELLKKAEDDSLAEPYKTKYQAAAIFQEIDCNLNNAGEDFALSLLSALMNYELGLIAFETEEIHNCEKYLDKSWEILKGHEQKSECILLSISVLNQLGILWSSREEPKKASDYLKTAEIIYGEYKFGKNPCPLSLEDLFTESNAKQATDWKPLEKVLTLTLYYLAQVYGHLNERELSAKYCHITLKRQFISNDYDPIDWCLNCATLSHYFVSKDMFWAARHVLSCSSHVISNYETNLNVDLNDSEKAEHLKRCKSDISRCWAFYSLQLLHLSQAKKSKEIEIGITDISLNELSLDDEINMYQILNDQEVKDVEKRIVHNFVTCYDEARLIFLFGIEHLQESKKYYVLSDHAYDYVQIIQENSKFYRDLASFENNLDRKCKMHKRRIDLLEEVLKELNPQFYLAVCRQLMFELAETYSEMMALKTQMLSSGQKEMASAVPKINHLINKSINHYLSFIHTFLDAKKELPMTFPEDSVRPILVAHFCIARLYSKTILPRSQKEVENWKKSETFYKFVVNYVEKNPQHEHFIKEELVIVKEMVELLSTKIERIDSS